ncbi:MAG: KH domain-containing protein [Coprobacillus sp.]|nr:KH domain-containing protein [Coprobacillus sp.]
MAMDYTKIIHAIIDPMVDDPESLFIREIPENDGKDLKIVVAAKADEISRLIGKKGQIANSIREVVSIAGKSDEIHVHITFESFDEGLGVE